MKSEFENLSANNAHTFDSNTNGDKQVVKIYLEEELIAKKIKHKKSIRYFAVAHYKNFITLEAKE